VVLALLLGGCTADEPTDDGSGSGSGGSTAAEETAAATPSQDVTIYLVRHGETVFNELGLMSGWSDSPLTPEGEEQAQTAGEALAEHDFTAAYVSDLGRTRQTAAGVLAGQGDDAPEPQLMPELREWYFGGFEGTPNTEGWSTVLTQHGYDWDAVQADLPAFATSIGGITGAATMFADSDPLGLAEDRDAIVERVTAGFDALVADAQAQGGGDVLVVSHGLTIATLLEVLDPGSVAVGAGNLALTVIEVHGDDRAVTLTNSTDYLGEDED
jgi:probable phosphoglycerate mutase